MQCNAKLIIQIFWLPGYLYVKPVAIAHNPRVSVASVPRLNCRYLGKLPIAYNPRFFVARVPTQNIRYLGQLSIACNSGLAYPQVRSSAASSI